LRRRAFLIVTAVFLVAGDSPKDKGTKKDMEKLLGTWSCVSGQVNGKPIQDETVKLLKLKMTADSYTTTKGDETLFVGAYRLDSTTNPKSIDIIATDGENEGKVALGIYDVDGDSCKLCYTMGVERPKEFASKPGSGAFFAIWKRAKP